jgi:hypothetical protein
MLRLISTTLLLLLCIAAWGQGLLINPSFEEGWADMATGWTNRASGEDWLRIRGTDWRLLLPDGEYAITCDVDNGEHDNPGWAFMDNDAVIPAGSYDLSFYAMVWALVSPMPVSFALGDWTETILVPRGTTWTQYQLAVTTSLPGQLAIGVFAGGDDRGFLDAMILSEVPEPMPIVVLALGCAVLAGTAGTRRMRLP